MIKHNVFLPKIRYREISCFLEDEKARGEPSQGITNGEQPTWSADCRKAGIEKFLAFLEAEKARGEPSQGITNGEQPTWSADCRKAGIEKFLAF